MKQTEKAFLQVVSCCFNEGKKPPELDEKTLMEVLELSRLHNILPLVYSALYASYSGSDAVKRVKGFALRQFSSQSVRTERFLSLYHELSEQNIRAICVKGVILRSLYKNGECRVSTDEDLLIEDGQLDLFCAFMEKQGFVRKKRTETEASFVDKAASLIVEAGTAPFSVSGKPGKVLNSLFASPFDNAVPCSVYGREILTLSPQQNLLYLVCHAYKHFIHSGFGIRQVCDIAVFLERYIDETDLPRLRSDLSLLGAAPFFETLLDIAANDLGFESLLPFAGRGVLNRERLLDDILRGGVYGFGEPSRTHSASLTLSAVENQSNRLSAFRAVFPKRETLAANHPALERFPVLYPYYAASRIMKYLCSVGAKKEIVGTPSQSSAIARERLELMEQLGIVPPSGRSKEEKT